MELIVERVDVWAASIKDEPGGLAWVLDGLQEVGADLDCIIARRSPDKPGTGVVFVTPIRGDTEISAAADLGFNVSNSIHSVRIEGENKPGIAAELMGRLPAEGINVRGVTASVLGKKFVLYIGLDTPEDAEKALGIFQA